MASTASDLPRIDARSFMRLADERLPFLRVMNLACESIDADEVCLRARYDASFLRPGGTIAGPVLMALADAALYALVLSRIGPVELAVTTQLSINFLSKPPPGDVLARARALKVGRRLAVGEVSMYGADDAERLVAHATGTYSIPPETIA